MEAGFNPGLKTGAACPHRCSALLGYWLFRLWSHLHNACDGGGGQVLSLMAVALGGATLVLGTENRKPKSVKTNNKGSAHIKVFEA